MEDDRFSRALSRIEAAAGRIERASRQAGADAALRREAQGALAELDRLIARIEP